MRHVTHFWFASRLPHRTRRSYVKHVASVSIHGPPALIGMRWRPLNKMSVLIDVLRSLFPVWGGVCVVCVCVSGVWVLIFLHAQEVCETGAVHLVWPHWLHAPPLRDTGESGCLPAPASLPAGDDLSVCFSLIYPNHWLIRPSGQLALHRCVCVSMWVCVCVC